MSLNLVSADFESRWAAWQQRGRKHDRLFRTRLRLGLPTVAFVLVLAYLLFIR